MKMRNISYLQVFLYGVVFFPGRLHNQPLHDLEDKLGDGWPAGQGAVGLTGRQAQLQTLEQDGDGADLRVQELCSVLRNLKKNALVMASIKLTSTDFGSPNILRYIVV